MLFIVILTIKGKNHQLTQVTDVNNYHTYHVDHETHVNIDFLTPEKLTIKSDSDIQPAIINITHNDNFTDYAFITGIGTEGDPYLIKDQNLSCTGQSGISIQNVSKIFHIINCTMTGTGNTAFISLGIMLQNTTHSKVINNTVRGFSFGLWTNMTPNLYSINNSISQCIYGVINRNSFDHSIIHNNEVYDMFYYGIIVRNQTDSMVTNNTVYDVTYTGITVEENSMNVMVANNTVHDASAGITAYESYNVSIMRNFMTNLSGNAVQITSQNCRIIENYASNCSDDFCIEILLTNNTLIANNTLINSSMTGFYLIAVNNTYIYHNYLDLNTENGDGIFLYEADNTIIRYNTIKYAISYGVNIHSNTKNTLVEYNDFISSGHPQASDAGINNLFQKNYWNDHTTPDDNSDYIVDTPYSLNGTANNSDLYPLTVEFSTYLDLSTTTTTTTTTMITTTSTVNTSSISSTTITTIPGLSTDLSTSNLMTSSQTTSLSISFWVIAFLVLIKNRKQRRDR